jgi:hypothetical protein
MIVIDSSLLVIVCYAAKQKLTARRLQRRRSDARRAVDPDHRPAIGPLDPP